MGNLNNKLKALLKLGYYVNEHILMTKLTSLVLIMCFKAFTSEHAFKNQYFGVAYQNDPSKEIYKAISLKLMPT